MASLSKVGGLILGLAALFYAAAVLLILAMVPPETGALDTGSVFSDRKAYRLEERYLLANLWSLKARRDRVVILGSSSARLTFRPTLLQPSLPGVEIDNLSIEGANVGEARKTLHLIYQAMPADWRGHTIFVLGVTYTNFVEDRFAFQGLGDNLTKELQRFDLYRENKDGVYEARFSPALMRAATVLTRPVLIIIPYAREAITGIVPSDLRERLNRLLRRKTLPGDTGKPAVPEDQSDAAYDSYVVAPDLRARLVQLTMNGFGGDHALPRVQFMELKKMAQEITAHGDRFVIVDMPLPRWHVQGLPRHTNSYREEMAAMLRGLLAQPNIGYLDLRALDDPDNFFDAVHPKPRVRKLLSADLAGFLKNSREGNTAP